MVPPGAREACENQYVPGAAPRFPSVTRVLSSPSESRNEKRCFLQSCVRFKGADQSSRHGSCACITLSWREVVALALAHTDSVYTWSLPTAIPAWYICTSHASRRA